MISNLKGFWSTYIQPCHVNMLACRIMGWIRQEEEGDENTKSNAKRNILFVVFDMSSKLTYIQ